MRIADLFASVGIDVDAASMRRAEQKIERFQAQLRADHAQNSAYFRAVANRDVASFGAAASGALSKVASVATRVAKLGVLATGAAFVAATKDAMDFDAILTDLDVSSAGAVGNLGELRKKMLEVSTATGVSKEQVAAGAQAYVTLTGDAKTAVASLDVFSRVAFGQKAEMQDVATVAATLGQQFGLTSKQFEQAFSILSAGAKAGAVEFRDMAGLMASLGANVHRFGDSGGIKGVAQLGAMFQVAKQGFGSAAETATGLESLMGGIQQINKAKLKSAGLTGKNGFTQYEKDGKTLKPLLQIVDELSKKKLNATQLFDLLGRKEAVKTFDVVSKGRAEVDKLATSLIRSKDVMTDFRKRAESPSARAAASWNAFKNSIASVFTPEVIEKFSNAISATLESLIEFGGVFKEYVIEPIMTAINAIVDLGKKIADLVEDFGRLFVVDEESSVNNYRDRTRSKLDRTKAAIEAAKGGASQSEVNRILGSGQSVGEQRGKKARLDAFASTGNKAYLYASDRGLSKMSKLDAKVAMTLDITGTGTNAEDVAKHAGGMLEKFWDAKLRQAAAGVK